MNANRHATVSNVQCNCLQTLQKQLQIDFLFLFPTRLRFGMNVKQPVNVIEPCVMKISSSMRKPVQRRRIEQAFARFVDNADVIALRRSIVFTRMMTSSASSDLKQRSPSLYISGNARCWQFEAWRCNLRNQGIERGGTVRSSRPLKNAMMNCSPFSCWAISRRCFEGNRDGSSNGADRRSRSEPAYVDPSLRRRMS